MQIPITGYRPGFYLAEKIADSTLRSAVDRANRIGTPECDLAVRNDVGILVVHTQRNPYTYCIKRAEYTCATVDT